MFTIDLTKLFGEKELEKENIDIENIRKKVFNNKGKYIFNSNYNHHFNRNVGNHNFFNKRAKEIIKSEGIDFKNKLEEQLFLNSFVFSDNEKFIQTLTTYNIDINNLKTIINRIYKFKIDGKKYLKIKSKNFELLQKHYNLDNIEIIINKFLELFYFYPELTKCKNKQKKL